MIHTAEREVLLLQRADARGGWQSVTGSRADPLEPLAETARREVLEETGLVVGASAGPLQDEGHAETFTIFPEYRHRYAPGTMTNREHVFSLRAPRDAAIAVSPREHTAWRWLPAAQAAAACFSRTNAEAIRRLLIDR